MYVDESLRILRRTFLAYGKPRKATFELSPEDEGLRKIMAAYENGEFGKDREGLEVLMSILKERKYNVDVLANNIFLIEHVVEKYSQRIIRTIKKNK